MAGSGGEGQRVGKDLFAPVAANYAKYRPTYPSALFDFLAQHTGQPRGLAWDAGTGSGQAAVELAQRFESVVATDLSAGQVAHASQRPNIRYAVTAPTMSDEELGSTIGPPGSVDLITIAQAYHWFDFTWFPRAAQRVLRKGGVVAVWGYGLASVSPEFDCVMWEWYQTTWPFWEPQRKLIDAGYTTIPFPFKPLPGLGADSGPEGTGPIPFASELHWTLHDYFGYLSSWSPMPTARKAGVELLDYKAKEKFHAAWGDAASVRKVSFPIFLRIGTMHED